MADVYTAPLRGVSRMPAEVRATLLHTCREFMDWTRQPAPDIERAIAWVESQPVEPAYVAKNLGAVAARQAPVIFPRTEAEPW